MEQSNQRHEAADRRGAAPCASPPLVGPFDLYSPGARRLYMFEFQSEGHLLAAEARRTLDAVAAAAPARIDKGHLTRDEAARQAALWLAIAEDLEAYDRWIPAGRDAGRSLNDELVALRAKSGVAWADKVRELRREIEARRLGYPAEVDKGRLTKQEAKDQLDRIEAIHDLYWRHGYAFDGTKDELRAMTPAVLDSYEFTQPRGDSSTVEHSADELTVAGSSPAPRSISTGANA